MSGGYGTTPFEELIPPPTAVNNTHRDTSIASAIIVLGILTTLIVFARLVQRHMSKNLGPDDYAIVPAVVRMSFKTQAVHKSQMLASLTMRPDLLPWLDSHGCIFQPPFWAGEAAW